MKHAIVEVSLPLPEQALWPNARPHWAVKAKAVQKARELAWLLTNRTGDVVPGPYRVEIEATPRTRVFDEDNCKAACKSYVDGICERLGINDRDIIESKMRRLEPDKENAGVVIRILEVQA
jgi:hypothetical protein